MRTYLATQRADQGIGEGYGVRYAVASAADSLAVDVGQVALLVLEKLIECGRARAARQAMEAADAEIDPDAHKAILPHGHRVASDRG